MTPANRARNASRVVMAAVAVCVTLVMVAPLNGQNRESVPIPSFTPVTGPGPMYAGLMEFPQDTSLEHFKYVAKEYFISGMANGAPYTTRIVVRQPADARKFSGIVVAEAMHPSGYSWMFAFNHTYMMNEGHVSLEIVSGLGPVPQSNPERYKSLSVQPAQANDVIAQAGALAKSNLPNGPLGALRVRRLVLMGTSASARILTGYLPTHMVRRMPDGSPIFDGFLPTSIGGDMPIQKVDVPLIHMPTMTEVNAGAATGNKYRRPDGDRPGDQFRIYEVAGMAHNDSRENLTYSPDPCKYPVSRFPEAIGMSIGLHHLLGWVDKGKVPPHADYIMVDGDRNNDGSLMALDANGNVKGGIRNTYVDVPVVRYGVPNEQNPTPIPNPSSHVAGRQGGGGAAFYCGIAGHETSLPADHLKTLYKNKDDYRKKIEQRLDQLTKESWFLPVYKSLVLADAARVNLP